MTQTDDEASTYRTFQLAAMNREAAMRLAIAQNVATNGRLFCAICAAANYASGHPNGVLLAAWPVAFAWLADVMPPGWMKDRLPIASIWSACVLAIVTLLNCW
ncbi:MAG: hypothetical protein E5V54_11260 [Mesorhizobium sp.]|nr:MAG: hypothetical protein E5V54_11260 [Mesorhizobium sp.]